MHNKVGTWQSHGLPYWESYLRGELDYDSFARMDVAAWAGAPAALLHEAAAEVDLMPGCESLLTALNAAGIAVAIVSNGLACVAERFRAEFGVRHVFANHVAIRNDLLTGDADLRTPYDDKGLVLRELVAELGLAQVEVAALGDIASDVAMFG